MPIYTTNQISAINLSHIFNATTTKYNMLQDAISSGNKYASASENPFAVVKTSSIDVQLSANASASSNAAIGKNLLTVVEDTQDQVVESLQRIRDLCLQVSNETNASDSKDAVLMEIRQRLSKFDDMAEDTSFNNVKLFDGSVTSMELQVGSSSNNVIDIGSAFTKLYASALGGDIRIGSSVNGTNWSTEDIHNYMDKIDMALGDITANITESGAYSNRLSMVTNNLSVKNLNLKEGRSAFMDTDVASASTEMMQQKIMQQATMSILAQANQIPSIALSLLGS